MMNWKAVLDQYTSILNVNGFNGHDIERFLKEGGELSFNPAFEIKDLVPYPSPHRIKIIEKAIFDKTQSHDEISRCLPPIIVTIKEGKFRLHDGHHRTKIAQSHGILTLPAFVVDRDKSLK